MKRTYTERDDPVAHAWTGDFERLAKQIANGCELTEDMRVVLVAILRGQLQFAKGTRRTFAQIQLDRDAALDISRAILVEPELSKAKAMDFWLDANPNVSKETLKKMLRRATRDRIMRQERNCSLAGVIKRPFGSPD